MSYNKRTTQKRGGRYKNNFVDNGNVRRTNVESHTIPHSAQLRPVAKSLTNETNNVQNISDFYDDPTTLYLLCKYYLGNFVTIKTDTEEFNGVLKAVSPNGDFCLTEATVFAHNLEYISRNEKFKMIPIKDIKVVEVKNVDSEYNAQSPDSNLIPTDDEIVKLHRAKNGGDRNYDVNGIQEVELTPFYDGSISCDDNCLNANKVGAHWFSPEEMFEKNKKRFNVQSTYSEDLEGYTTKLHKDDPNYQKDLLMAQRKAQEIEKNRDQNFDDLENDDETNEEFLFCSVSRPIESPNKTVLNNKTKFSDFSSKSSPHNHNQLSSPQDSNDLKHNLNPNAREFTPISPSISNYEFGNTPVPINSMNLQPSGPYHNFIHPSNLMPYPVPVMFPPHHPNHGIQMMHNPGMEQYFIPRANFIPNYSMPPFILPNQCQIAFDPNMLASNMTNAKFDNGNFPNVSYPSSSNDVQFERDNNQNEGINSQSEMSEDTNRREESEMLNKFNEEMSGDQTNSGMDNVQYSTNISGDHSYESAESSASSQMAFQKLSQANSGPVPAMYGQLVTGNPPTYILPANMAHGLRNVGPYPPQMISNHMQYIPNYFSRQAPIVAPFHQVPPNLSFQMKPNPNGGFQPAYPANQSFVPVLNQIAPGHNFPTFIPGYPPSLIPAGGNNMQYQIPLHPNLAQFPPFITPQMQPCNYFTSMPQQQQQQQQQQSQMQPQ